MVMKSETWLLAGIMAAYLLVSGFSVFEFWPKEYVATITFAGSSPSTIQGVAPRPSATTWPCGFNEAPAPLNSSYVVLNSWGCDLKGEHIVFYAGYFRNQPSQGFVIAMAHSLDLTKTGGHTYFGPSGEGALRILSFQRGVLNVRTAKGRRLNFRIPNAGYPLVGL
jgi:hypothetical protein